MEVLCGVSSTSYNSLSFLLAQEVLSATFSLRRRSAGNCKTSVFKGRHFKIKDFQCSNRTSMLHYDRRRKLDRQSGGLDSNFRNTFHLPMRSDPCGGRRKMLCRDAKNMSRGGPDECIGDAVCEVSPGSSLNDDEMLTVSPEESNVSCHKVSPLEMDCSTSRVGVLITAWHFLLAAGAVVLVDYKVLASAKFDIPFRLTLPFFLSAGVTAILGYFFVPVLELFKAAQILRIEGPASHKAKSGTPTMGGLFFIPVGVVIAGLSTGFKSLEVQGAMIFTLAFAGIGLMDDSLAFWRKHNYGLPGGIKLMMQVVVGIGLFYWLEVTKVPFPHKINHAVWFPAPFGLLHLGGWYLPLTAFCCAAMSNGVNLTDGLDGLAAGTAAVAFIAMSAAVLPVFPALGVFGTSMAGACFGFLVHNSYKAKVFMGDTGSLALGGALAAMACCTGMFFPLFIASGVFVIESLSVICQVFYFKLTKQLYGEGRRLFRMSPFHHHLELIGLKEPLIVLMAYYLSIALGLAVAYLVLGKNGKFVQ